MSISLRKLGLATGLAVLGTGAAASAASAANITVSYSSGTLAINDPSGVLNAEIVSTAGSGFDITEVTSGNVLVAGSGVTFSVNYSASHKVAVASGAITRVSWNAGNGNDGINASGVTNVPVSLFGEGGNDYIDAGTLGDVLNGGAGNDTIYGENGNDIITGFTGADTIYAGNGDDQIFENDGSADTVDGGNDYDEFTRDSLDTATNVEKYI